MITEPVVSIHREHGWRHHAASASSIALMETELFWRGDFTSHEVNSLHAEAFRTPVYDDAEWDWRDLVEKWSLGWVTARARLTDGTAGGLVGFANVISDGLVHAWIQDVMVAASARRHGIGRLLVKRSVDGARAAGCEWLHVDFDDDDLRAFYLDACGFVPTNAGLRRL